MKKVFCAALAVIVLLAFSGCFKVDIDLPVSANPAAPVTSATVYEPAADIPVIGTEASAPVAEVITTAAPTVPYTSPTEYHDDYDLPEYNAPPTTVEAPAKSLIEMNDAEVLEYFNKALNAVKQQRAGFKKSKLTSVLDLTFSNPAANSVVSVIKSALLSDTAEETVVNKGDMSVDVMSPSGKDYASRLNTADIAGVKVTKTGDNYVIRVDMNEATNPDENSSYAKIFDFMTVDDVMKIYAPKVGATVAEENIEVSFSGCYAELTVDGADRAVGYRTYVQGVMNMKNATVKKVITINTDVAVTLGSTTDYTNFVY